MTRRHGERRRSTLKRRNLAFKRAIGRVHDARVDVAELLQREEARRMVGIVEHIGCRLIDRGYARLGRRVRLGPGVDGKCVDLLAHGMLSCLVAWSGRTSDRSKCQS